MKEMTDSELDLLISETFERQEQLAEIESSVMKTLARDRRRRLVRHWGRLCAIAAGLAVTIVGYGWLLTASRLAEQQPLTALTGAAVMAGIAYQFIARLHIEEV